MVSTISEKHKLKLVDLRHPYFSDMELNWVLWRDTYEGGDHFVNKYLKQFSAREDGNDYALRRDVTYCPSFAAAAVDDVKNSIYQRMVDIVRVNGPKSFITASLGEEGGVDLCGSSMNYYIGQRILPELLIMRRVGIYVDMPVLDGPTLYQVKDQKIRPYIYLYRAEEILNWVHDLTESPNEYTQLLLQEMYTVRHPEYGFPYDTATRYRYMYLDPNDGYCRCQYYDLDGNPIDELGNKTEQIYQLGIKRIPFYCFEIPKSLLKDVCRHQIALLNIESSDINYILKANFPFYTEQKDFRVESEHIRTQGEEESDTKEVRVGVTSGRAYGQGLERPGFIHPSTEPLQASMAKQEKIQRDIRLLINLALTNMTPTKQQSVESKQLDNQGLESGLSFIGMELEKGERRIAEFWAMYSGEKPSTIYYPTKYSLKSDTERREEAKQYKELLPIIPSVTYQKHIGKQIARGLLGFRIPRPDMDKIENEIDKAAFMVIDPEITQKDVELGILDRENAAKARLYPDDVTEKANKEHAERLKVIQESQAVKNGNGQARGNPDGSSDPTQGKKEKEESRNTDKSVDNETKVRGKANP